MINISSPVSASVRIYNAQTKSLQHESVVKSACKERWLHVLINSYIVLQTFNVSKEMIMKRKKNLVKTNNSPLFQIGTQLTNL